MTIYQLPVEGYPNLSVEITHTDMGGLHLLKGVLYDKTQHHAGIKQFSVSKKNHEQAEAALMENILTFIKTELKLTAVETKSTSSLKQATGAAALPSNQTRPVSAIRAAVKKKAPVTILALPEIITAFEKVLHELNNPPSPQIDEEELKTKLTAFVEVLKSEAKTPALVTLFTEIKTILKRQHGSETQPTNPRDVLSMRDNIVAQTGMLVKQFESAAATTVEDRFKAFRHNRAAKPSAEAERQ